MTPTVLAVTGATGFVGKRFVDAAVASGIGVHALTRRDQPERAGVQWVPGSLDDRDALLHLMDGADAVVHIAGVVNTPTREGFRLGNVEGTRNVVDAAREMGVKRFIHVSSLSAREPDLSDYGWSKAQAEKVVGASGLEWTMVRPPAIYGPGDSDMLEVFKMAKRGFVLLPPRGRASIIHADDLSRLLLVLAGEDQDSLTQIYEVDDGVPNGWSHESLARAMGWAVGKRVSVLHAPAGLMRLAAKGDRMVRGDKARLTPDRAAYFAHPDWVVTPGRQPPASLWQPEVETREGLKHVAQWYQEQGWL